MWRGARMKLSAVSRPGRSLPGQNKEPFVRTLVVCSGGLDSVTLSHKIVIEKTLIHLVSFDYGQRHRKELDCARRCATRLGITHDIIDITDIGRRLTGSALTDGTAVPDGHYAEETMRSTIVPNRNVIMLTIAFGVATVRRAEAVAAAVHGGDHFIYPDCRLSFVDAFATMQRNSLWSRSPPQKRGKASIRSQRNPQYSRQSQLGRLSGLAQ
jgi:7-cyano-7-deazaguanine synthase